MYCEDPDEDNVLEVSSESVEGMQLLVDRLRSMAVNGVGTETVTTTGSSEQDRAASDENSREALAIDRNGCVTLFCSNYALVIQI